MLRVITLGLCLLGATSFVFAAEDGARKGNVLSLINIVRFQNFVCGGTNRNGTCLTADECEDQGGKQQGDCADGFGKCCVFELACGGRSAQNNSYLVQTATSSQPVTGTAACNYEICPASAKIMRIRFDFTTFVLNTPNLATVGLTGTVNGAGSTGDCSNDLFQISGVGGTPGSPVICGTNSGQHMILDNDGMNCHFASFVVGSGSFSRSWDIWVTQYTSFDAEIGRAGPMGCLQYFTGTSGFVHNYAGPNAATLGTTATTTAAVTHLNNQKYNACIRREADKKTICYAPIAGTTAIIVQGSFGVSVSPNIAAAQAGSNTNCITDFVEILGGQDFAINAGAATATPFIRFCGRFVGSQAATAHITVCTTITPFIIKYNFDASEAAVGTTNMVATTNEEINIPSGTVGAGFVYIQT